MGEAFHRKRYSNPLMLASSLSNRPFHPAIQSHPPPFMSASEPLDPLEAFLTKVASEDRLPAPASTSRLRYTPEGLVMATPAALARLRAIAALSEDTCCSFNEWKAAGYWVKKGAKSHFTDALGIPQFTIEQVEKSKWQSRR